ncbi:hypothetical protein FACS189425_10160 [Clostridia bacterium]|nr:hypothetical protein FACS189425_10160 [Clostridia bacterium]
MKHIKNKLNRAYFKVRDILADRRGAGYFDEVIKYIIAIVIGALLLAGLYLLWNNVVLPRLNTEVQNMFGYHP